MRCMRIGLVLCMLGAAMPATALVRMDEGALMIDGVQLLREYGDEKSYRYVPQYPRLARKPTRAPN